MTYAISSLVLTLLAAPAEVGWVAEPQPLSQGIDQADLAAIGQALGRELSKTGRTLYGTQALLEHSTPAPDPGSGLPAARSLLAEGEDLYMAFKFDAAAEMLAKAADLFNDSLALLKKDDLEMLYRARLLAGLSWFEAGKVEVAREAFVRLIVIRPDFEPDPTLVSPKAREVFRAALSQVRSSGVGSLEVRSQPEGAEVFLDGLPRGRSPITIAPLAGDKHFLRLRLPGYQTHIEEIESRPPEKVVRSVKLEPTLTLTARNRLQQAARQGQAPEVAAADLDLIARTAKLGSIVLTGVSELPDGDLLISARRWTPSGTTAAAARTRRPKLAAATARLAAQLASGDWSPDQLPPESTGVRLDFARILLGVDPDWKPVAAAPEESGILGKWWFWTGLAVVAGGLTAGIVVLSSPDSPPPDATRFVLDF